jgi:hypothetical protein
VKGVYDKHDAHHGKFQIMHTSKHSITLLMDISPCKIQNISILLVEKNKNSTKNEGNRH